MDQKVVLVTGIGGNVGQGIIRNIRTLQQPIKVIGCNVTEFSAGNHLCDKFHLVPFSYEEEFIPAIIKIVEKEKIDLIIPSTDYEVYYLAKHADRIPCTIATSASETTEIYLDKYKSFLHHQKHDIPFAKAYLPSDYNNEFAEFIAKPREGRGSRGLAINPPSYQDFSDDYMIQELFKGIEITTAFYVNKQNKLHGFINLERKLDNGATNECRVNRNYDDQLKDILEKIIQHSSIRGSANLQSIVTADGKIMPFEVNCRISGTNSIRSNFGFEDVKYTLEEYLYNTAPSEPKIINGVAIRIMMDVIYPNQESNSNLSDNSSKHFIY
ncbi:ATP-grasp domain-containing protein [Albibacterium sp.]|uniref:ATP-grasp domain-containing protein n=1 Tax=Albibacterium sp. TaxID=2952885 RepID=UPI002BB86114|nr:ATP-grasp domain-containing protein [Albibacterium sp.]HUH18921.1 ATP-grasp domain-containing protein [Albibacterium sp.]